MPDRDLSCPQLRYLQGLQDAERRHLRLAEGATTPERKAEFIDNAAHYHKLWVQQAARYRSGRAMS